MGTTARILLVQPKFPIPSKSLNHKNYLPIGLLKLSSWHKAQGNDVALCLGELNTDFAPDEVLVTSLFTYWADHVRTAVEQCRLAFPAAKITVGGIYASLQPDHCRRFTGCDEVFVGVHEEAEQSLPDYSLVETDFQIVHASRGCVRRCRFCGTHVIEPVFAAKRSIASEVVKRHIVFYDNNFLANPYIAELLTEIAELRVGGRVVTCESQSGFDGRILRKTPSLASLLKRAHFRNPRIAWDSGLNDGEKVESVIELLRRAGFARKDIEVFMLYDHELTPEVLMGKVEQCYAWGVQVSDCRFRPLDYFADGYNPRVSAQLPGEYYIHEGWTDGAIRSLRRAVRTNNICLRYGIPRDRYDYKLEQLSRHVRRELMGQLGMTAAQLTEGELELVNSTWLEGLLAEESTRRSRSNSWPQLSLVQPSE